MTTANTPEEDAKMRGWLAAKSERAALSARIKVGSRVEVRYGTTKTDNNDPKYLGTVTKLGECSAGTVAHVTIDADGQARKFCLDQLIPEPSDLTRKRTAWSRASRDRKRATTGHTPKRESRRQI